MSRGDHQGHTCKEIRSQTQLHLLGHVERTGGGASLSVGFWYWESWEACTEAAKTEPEPEPEIATKTRDCNQMRWLAALDKWGGGARVGCVEIKSEPGTTITNTTKMGSSTTRDCASGTHGSTDGNE